MKKVIALVLAVMFLMAFALGCKQQPAEPPIEEPTMHEEPAPAPAEQPAAEEPEGEQPAEEHAAPEEPAR